jgi:flagellar biosynthesis/type III secretory pathway chaperone
MIELLSNLIEALREELKQYGELLALLDQQQALVMCRQTTDLPENVSHVNAQAALLARARQDRAERQRQLARALALPETAAFGALIPHLPADYQPLVGALVAENNELLARVQGRARQNHLLMSHCVELMQQFIHSIFPAAAPATYDEAGRRAAAEMGARALYEAIG